MMTAPQETIGYGPARGAAEVERERLILEHLPVVEVIARRIHDRLPSHVPLDDLISAGVIGLISAIDNYDPSHGAKISTYANYKVRGAILDSLRQCDWGSRYTRKRCRSIEVAIAAAERKLGRTPTEDEILAELNMTAEEYHSALLDLHALNLESLEEVAGRDSDAERIQFITREGEPLPSQIVERAELERLVAAGIERMPKLEGTILSLYYYEELSLAEIAQVTDLHISRVSHIKSQAILRLRSALATTWPRGRGGSDS